MAKKLITFENATDTQLAECAKFAGLDEKSATADAMYAEPMTKSDRGVIIKWLRKYGYKMVDITKRSWIEPTREEK